MTLGLFARLAITLSVVLTLAMLSLGAVLLFDAQRQFKENQLEHASTQAKILAEASLDALITADYELLERWVVSVIPEKFYAYAYLAKSDGQVLTHSDNIMVARYLEAMGELKEVRIKKSTYKERPVMMVSHPARIGDSHLANATVAYYLDEEKFFEKSTSVKIVLLILLALVPLLGVTLYIIRKFTDPISQLTDYISGISITNKNFRIDEKLLSSWGEIGVLSRAYEAMIKRLLGAFEELSHEEERLKEQVEKRTHELKTTNLELEKFSYSVSHDLRSPLHAISSFSKIIQDDYSDKLDEDGKDYLVRIYDAAHKMEVLINDLLELSRVKRKELEREDVNLSLLVTELLDRFTYANKDREVEFKITEGLICNADRGLLIVVMENLIGNAWKYASKKDKTMIEFGHKFAEGKEIFFIKDNGAGFDMKYVEQLFEPFQRLHGDSDFAGTGVGLATVARIIKRHNGKIWAEAEVGKGATFYFYLSNGD